MKSVMELQIPGQPEYVRVARLAVAGTASCAGFQVEQIDEIKQSVGEACSNAVAAVRRNGEGQVTIRCKLQEDDRMVIEVSPVGFQPDALQNDDRVSFQYFLISTLMDDVELIAEGSVEAIKMTRGLPR